MYHYCDVVAAVVDDVAVVVVDADVAVAADVVVVVAAGIVDVVAALVVDSGPRVAPSVAVPLVGPELQPQSIDTDQSETIAPGLATVATVLIPR